MDRAAVAPTQRSLPLSVRFPETLELVLGNEIYIAKDAMPPALRNRLLRLAAFQNPEFYKAQAMRLSTRGKPRVIGCAEDHPQHIGLPRGCLEDLVRTLSALGIQPHVRDERCTGTPLEVSFLGALRPEQKPAAEALAAHDTGVLAATTAFGKTVIAAWLIAQRGVNTLILVCRQAVDGAVGGATLDFSRAAPQGHRPHRGREEEAHRQTGRGADAESGSQRRGG